MNTDKHLVSIIMPVNNGGEFLKVALESIQNQQYPELEIIIVDDGSTDGSYEVVESFSRTCPKCVKVLKHADRKRRGIAASYRLGIENCRGNYIAFLEQDDLWATNKLSEQVRVFEKFPEVGVVFSNVFTCDERGLVANKAFKTLINRPPSEQPFHALCRLLWGNFILTFSNITVRGNLINQYDIIEEPEGFQDWMLLLLLSSRCMFYHCNRTKIFWRQQKDSYYGKIKQLPNYMSMHKKLRKLAIKNAIDRINVEGQSSCSHLLLLKQYSKRYCHSVISILSATERIADTLKRRINSKELFYNSLMMLL